MEQDTAQLWSWENLPSGWLGRVGNDRLGEVLLRQVERDIWELEAVTVMCRARVTLYPEANKGQDNIPALVYWVESQVLPVLVALDRLGGGAIRRAQELVPNIHKGTPQGEDQEGGANV